MEQTITREGDALMVRPSTVPPEGQDHATGEGLSPALPPVHRDGEQAAMRVLAKATTMAELRESNQTLCALIQASPLAIIALDRSREVKLWNPAAERLLGWSEQETIGRPLPSVPEDRQDEFHVQW